MASGDLLKKLFRSFKQLDDEGFYAAALEIINQEKQKNHTVLARDLLRIIENGNTGIKPVSSAHYVDFQRLPRDREKGTLLFELRTSEKYLDDIILDEELKRQVNETLKEFRAGAILKSYGLTPRRKLLMTGPPGCGKTLCAEVFSGELGLPLLYTRFDAVISSYLGETAANLRKVFEFAQSGTWVVFFDEFDAIGKSRDDLSEHGELKRVVNTFLQLLDRFQTESLFIAATNHESMLDRALWRRFDDILYFGLPNEDQIKELLNLKLKGFHHRKLNIQKFISKMVGWSYADIERVCIDSIKQSILDGNNEVTDADFIMSLEQQANRAEIIKKSQK